MKTAKPGHGLIYWGWCLILMGAVLSILFPPIGGLMVLIGAVSVISGYVTRANHSGEA